MKFFFPFLGPFLLYSLPFRETKSKVICIFLLSSVFVHFTGCVFMYLTRLTAYILRILLRETHIKRNMYLHAYTHIYMQTFFTFRRTHSGRVLLEVKALTFVSDCARSSALRTTYAHVCIHIDLHMIWIREEAEMDFQIFGIF